MNFAFYRFFYYPTKSMCRFTEYHFAEVSKMIAQKREAAASLQNNHVININN